MIWLIGQHVILCAVLAMVVALCCKVFRMRPAVAHALWLVVLIRLMVPPVVFWPWTLPDFGAAQSQPVDEATPSVDAAANLAAWEGVTVEPATPSAASASNPATPAPSSRFLDWRTAGWLALALWLFGTFGLVLVNMVRLVRFNHAIGVGKPAPDWLVRDLSQVATRFGLPDPALRIVDTIPSPLFYGLRRPIVLLPAPLLDSVSRDRWPGVLTHELAHWKRRDHWVRVLELAAACVWWWNPVFWFVRRHLRETAELACDAWVVWALPEARRTYAETLIDISELVSRGAAPATALGLGKGVRMDFERRLTMILHDNVAAAVSRKALAALALVLVLSLPGLSAENAAPAPAPGPEPAAVEVKPEPEKAPARWGDERQSTVMEVLNKPITVEFEDEHLVHILEFISDHVNVNYVVDYRVVEPAKPNQPVDSQEATDQEEHAPADLGYVTDGVLAYINLQNVPLKDVLTALLTPLNLTYEAHPEFIWITAPDRIGKDPFGDPDTSKSKEAAEKLDKRVSIQFDDAHIARVAEFISDYVGVNIVIDQRAVPPPKPLPQPSGLPGAVPGGPPATPPPQGPGQAPGAGPGGAAAPGAAPFKSPPPPRLAQPQPEYRVAVNEGYAMTGYVSYLSLRNVSLREALKALTVPLDLTYTVEEGYIFITSPELAAKGTPAKPTSYPTESE